MSRGRKKAKPRRSGERILRSVPPATPAAVDECDCPVCAAEEELDPQEFVDNLVAAGAGLLDEDGPLAAELLAAGFIAVGEMAEGFDEALAEGIVPALAGDETPASLAVLLALDAVAGTPTSAAAVRRLTKAGVPAPRWHTELSEPVQLGECRRFADAEGESSILLCSFERAGGSHGFLINVDHLDCDAAADILFFAGDVIDQAIGSIREDGPAAVEEVLDPAEFRWQVERALDARAVHDLDLDEDEQADDLADESGPGYLPVARLLRARLRALPEPTRPPAPHGGVDDRAAAPAAGVDMPAELVTRLLPRPAGPSRGRKLPAKRTKAGPAAPIYQLKISLRAAKPPIWRRLELPADTGLARLHRIIQVAFGWTDSHLHLFETAYGDFGIADRELGYRAEGPVTLEQVAAPGDTFQYTYDFGDDWVHEIVVENALERQPGAYPRCTGGKRAGPPEDCGGLWGYADLIEVLDDPAHPEHEDQLEWLGVESAADFRPADFDPAEITQALTGLR